MYTISGPPVLVSLIFNTYINEYAFVMYRGTNKNFLLIYLLT